jgi:multicomponent Na+:H+ antiporter subunit D
VRGFFGRPHPDVALEDIKEAPTSMVVALCFTATVSVLLGLYPQVFMQFFGVFAVR